MSSLNVLAKFNSQFNASFYFQARILNEEWARRETLERLQEEQRGMLESERKKREEFERAQTDKEKQLRGKLIKEKVFEKHLTFIPFLNRGPTARGRDGKGETKAGQTVGPCSREDEEGESRTRSPGGQNEGELLTVTVIPERAKFLKINS